MIDAMAGVEREKEKTAEPRKLLAVLKAEKAAGVSGGIYHKVQIELTYNSNHMEGSRLSHEQTRYIYETNTLSFEGEIVRVDDVVETANHFRCIDRVIDQAESDLSTGLIKELQGILKNGTSDSRKDWFAVGDYKRYPNEVGGMATTDPPEVPERMDALIKNYNRRQNKTFEDLVTFHYEFERIHPFQDGNGRVGRLILFKECLKNNWTPFIITENLKFYYYRGLGEWPKQRGYLVETCRAAQDRFKAYLDYFKIEYDD